MSHKCIWCEEEYIEELVFKKEDLAICFECVMNLAAIAISTVKHNTMDMREMEKK